ncbi:MAG TPA: hypothetical protein VGR62_08470 [Candidatus Binatia bacterium]|jgi:hypothetical protein|nr:hypothetical protein [Candidatus Binatia bacterium]
MITLYAVWHNVVKMHATLRMTPAFEVGIVDTLWSMSDLVALIDAWPRQNPGRKPRAAKA